MEPGNASPLVSVVVPVYNVCRYIGHFARSLFSQTYPEIQFIFVNDGTKDDSMERLRKVLQEDFPALEPRVTVVEQPNRGLPAARRRGFQEVRGDYVLQVDSDDWIDREAYDKVRATLRDLLDKGTPVDMLLTNYVYEKPSENHERRMLYHTMFDDGKIVGWSDMKHLIPGFTILMHSVTYRTKMVRESGLHLPDHTFYVDNLYVYVPLPYVKTIYYLDVDYYRYYIGREGQSVAEQTMIKRIDRPAASCQLYAL